MKGLILATDFVKDNDGSFKILETNTSVAIATRYFENYFNSSRFTQLINDNEITEVYLLTSINGGVVDSIDLNYNEGDEINHYSKPITDSLPEGVTFEIKESPNGLIPYSVEDADHKLIIRLCYDQNALVDETYAKDNFELFKLLNDNNSTNLCPTYINGGGFLIDTLNGDLRDNGIYPNYLIKQRFPTSDYMSYPKIMKVDSLNDLETLKSNLLEDEMLQEYVLNTNDLLNGKVKTYRSVQMVYGPNLDIYDFMDSFTHTNRVGIDPTVDYDSNGVIQQWERPKFIQKFDNKSVPKSYHTQGDTSVILSDGTITKVGDVSVGDVIKSVDLYNLNLDNDHLWLSYREPKSMVISGSPMSTTTLIETKNGMDYPLLMKITLDDIITFTYTETGVLLTETPEGDIRFTVTKDLIVGDNCVVNTINGNEFLTKTITRIEYFFTEVSRFFFNVEESDLYLKVDDSSTPQFYMVNHNAAGVCNCYSRGDSFGGPFPCDSPCISSPDCQESYPNGQCCGSTPIGSKITNNGSGLCGPNQK